MHFESERGGIACGEQERSLCTALDPSHCHADAGEGDLGGSWRPFKDEREPSRRSFAVAAGVAGDTSATGKGANEAFAIWPLEKLRRASGADCVAPIGEQAGEETGGKDTCPSRDENFPGAGGTGGGEAAGGTT